MAKKLLSVREVSQILKISEAQVLKLVEEGKIPAYKVGGEFLRFDPEKILSIKSEIQKKLGIVEEKISFKDKFLDFIYFNDFYIISFIIIAFLLFFIIISI